MKRTFLVVFIVFLCNALFAQSAKDTLPPYLKSGIPPFNVYLYPDSIAFSKANLPKKKAVIYIVFSPDCDHCRHATEEMFRDFSKLKNTEIVFATPVPLGYIKKFYDDFNLSKYPNIHVGHDPGFFIGTFYAVKSYPSVHAYNKKGKLAVNAESHIDWKEIDKKL